MHNSLLKKYIIIFLILLLNLSYCKSEKNLANFGFGVEKKHQNIIIYLNAGIFTLRDQKIDKEIFEKILNQIESEIRNLTSIEIKPIFDQPQDSVFIIENVLKRKTNPDIHSQMKDNSYTFLNPFLVEDVKNYQKYFLSSSMNQYLFRQVNYDIIIIPYPLLIDFSYSNKFDKFYSRYIEIGFAKGRTTLDQLGIIVFLDYSNPDSSENVNRLKTAFISFILGINPDYLINNSCNCSIHTSYEDILKTQNNCDQKKCSDFKNFIRMRNQLLHLYYLNNKGLLTKNCDKIGKFNQNLEFYLKFTHLDLYLQNLFKKNFENLKKKCNL